MGFDTIGVVLVVVVVMITVINLLKPSGFFMYHQI
jgi:hypothetical protein